jgi:hypothetical protein
MLGDTPKLKITHTDTRNDLVLLGLTDERTGALFEVELSSMDVASLMGAIRVALDEALGKPCARNVGMPGMQRVQYVETPETGYFRVFLGEHLYHEYPVPRNTTLGVELKEFGDRVEARNLAKATSRAPDSIN